MSLVRRRSRSAFRFAIAVVVQVTRAGSALFHPKRATRAGAMICPGNWGALYRADAIVLVAPRRTHHAWCV